MILGFGLNQWGFWFESLILVLLVADGYKVLGLCTDVDADVDAVVLLMGLWLLLMVRGLWSVDGGSGFVDFTDGQSSVIVYRWVSFFFYLFIYIYIYIYIYLLPI